MTSMTGVYIFVSSLMFTWTSASVSSIFSTEHFLDDVATPGTDIVARSAILVLYQEGCVPDDFDSRAHHLLYLMYDYGTSNRYIWHERNKMDTLDRRFLTEDSPCLSAFYFKKGESVLKPTETWSGDVPLHEWYWWHLQTEIIVKNQYSERIRVDQQVSAGFGPEMEWISIDPGFEATVTSFFGHILTISSDETESRILHAVSVSENTTEIVFKGKTDVNPFFLNTQNHNKWSTTQAWVWSHAVRHLRNFKQPLIVPNFTDTGYEKRQLPPDLYMLLKQFYQQQKQFRFSEPVNPEDGVHDNVGTKPPHMVLLNDTIRATIENVLRPQLEEWSKTKLKVTAIYGVREYYTGNLLKNHVDRLDTHVISAIVQIDQDKGTGEDWALEVIDFNGQRHQVKLLPGEMLFYESAKLIHGRPKPFQGKHFANCFVHFAPMEGWDYTMEGHYIFRSKRHGIIEKLDKLDTEITSAGKILWRKDEL